MFIRSLLVLELPTLFTNGGGAIPLVFLRFLECVSLLDEEEDPDVDAPLLLEWP